MLKYVVFFVTVCGILCRAKSASGADVFTTNQLGQGVVYRNCQYGSLYSSPQTTYVVDINLNDSAPSIHFPYLTGGAARTCSAHAATVAGALMCINGQMGDYVSGSGSFLRVNGVTVNTTAAGGYEVQAIIDSGSQQTNSIQVIPRPDGGWPPTALSNIFSAGPALITEGVKRTNYNMTDNLIYVRHPRTAAAWTYDNHLILVVVDGRSSSAAGMTMPELRDYVGSLGAVRNAFNLDGGGSSTMWTKVNNVGSVKNVPSDGQERQLVNCIAIVSALPARPSPPTNLLATAVADSVFLNWSVSSGTMNYTVWGAPTNQAYHVLGSVTGTSFTNSGLVAGTTYRYVVTAGNSLGNSNPSEAALVTVPCLALSAPLSPSLVPIENQITLNWKPATNAAGYIVNRATTPGGPYVALLYAANITNYADTSATDGTVYYYKVSATNTCGTVADSAEVSAPPRLLPPAANGTNFVLQARGGQSGTSCILLTTTNLATSSNWTPVVTNDFGADGSFLYTLPRDRKLIGQFFKLETKPQY